MSAYVFRKKAASLCLFEAEKLEAYAASMYESALGFG